MSHKDEINGAERANREVEERFWSIVDRDGLTGLPSDMFAALDILVDRAAELEHVVKALHELQLAELIYRRNHDAKGGSHRLTGRSWDLMRRAGDKARHIVDAHEVERILPTLDAQSVTGQFAGSFIPMPLEHKPKFQLSEYEVARGLMMDVAEPGVRVIRISTPTSMGKTSLLENIVGYHDIGESQAEHLARNLKDD